MSRESWKKLVNHYADGKPICNCGEAYYSPCGEGIDGQGIMRADMLVCKYGCSAAQIQTKEDIATIVLADLGIDA